MRVARAIAAAMIGVAGLMLLIVAGERFGILPRVPSSRGEDDFAVRIVWFLAMMVPAFAVFGVWVAGAAVDLAGFVLRFVALLGVSMLYLLAAGMLIERFDIAPSAENPLFVAVLFIWLLVSVSALSLAGRGSR